jgi:SAM-dependent methyltransferase
MQIKFWCKTLLHHFLPRGFGYHKKLHNYIDETYVHDRDKHPVRQKHYQDSGWKAEEKGTVKYRDYQSYEEYKVHQEQKYSEMLKIQGGLSSQEIAVYRLKFYRRFIHLDKYLPKTASILCAGARQGTEVEVLHDLGFKQAYGIDLNPGPDNKLVRVGDFMRLENESNSLDLVYSNCIDHAFNLDGFLAEQFRVVKPSGYVLLDIGLNGGGAFEAVDWDSELLVIMKIFEYFKKIIRVERETAWIWLLLQKS